MTLAGLVGDEALALPSEHAATIALRTQQVIAEETGVLNVADPLGGSPQEFAALIKADLGRWQPLVKALNLKTE